MKIYTALQIGDYHLNHCEDYLISEAIGKDKVLCAVMDGCTMGTDSYFAATLVGKLLRKIALARNYKELYDPAPAEKDMEQLLRSVMRELFKELNTARNHLLLDRNELLTTLLLLLIDRHTKQGVVLVIGDGVVCIDGAITDFDQDNKPDYLGFHLDEAFEAWYEAQHQKIRFDTFEDISIATDGIALFGKALSIENAGTIDPVQFLLQDKEKVQQEDMLYLKLKTLEHIYGLRPTDDLAIIRIIARQT